MLRSIPAPVRAALVAIALSIPVCWSAIGLAVAQGWIPLPDSPQRLRAFGPAALLARSGVPAESVCDVISPSVVVLAGHDEAAERFGFSLIDPEQPHAISLGEGLDGRRSEWLRAQTRTAVLWFRLGGDEYTTDDRATLADVRVAIEPISELGARQGRLGAQQGRIGAKQGALGARLGQLGARLAGAAAQAGLSGDRDARSRRESREIEAQMQAVSRQMEPLAREMQRLGEEMGRLGAEMGRLSAQVKRDVRTRLERTVREGRAERLHVDA